MPKVIIGVVILIIILVGGYFLFKGNGAGDQSATAMGTTTPTTIDTTGQNASATPTAPATGATAPTSVDTTTNPPQKIMNATLHTNKGDITVAFYPDQAPKTVENFIKLASSGYYDGVKFHRVIKGFMDQAGDPLTKDDSKKAQWGTGGPGYTIPDEFGTTYTNVAGTLAMANTGAPNSGGSQFFINAVDNHFLDGKYTVFGHVTAGMSVVTAINNVPTAPGDVPVDPVIITSVTVK